MLDHVLHIIEGRFQGIALVAQQLIFDHSIEYGTEQRKNDQCRHGKHHHQAMNDGVPHCVAFAGRD